MKGMEIHENGWKAMKDLRARNASLELSKGFCSGSKPNLISQPGFQTSRPEVYENHYKSMKAIESLLKSGKLMKIYENL